MITLCVPTRGRPERFAQMLASARDTAANQFEVVAVFDNDDATITDYELDDVRVVLTPPTENMAGLWDLAWHHASGDIAMLAADDIIFETPNWDMLVEDEFYAIPDRLLMVYCDDGSQRKAPTLPFVSREWIDTVGEFTPHDWQGWFADEWIWSMAAEIERVVWLRDVSIRHYQLGNDQTYQNAQMRRLLQGGLDGMRQRFYSVPEVTRRDVRIAKLRRAMDPDVKRVPEPKPPWYKQSLEWAAETRIKETNPATLVTVHCWQGDKELVERHMPLYLHHETPVLVMSPEDSPVHIENPGVTNFVGGMRGYFGQPSLDRQRIHMEHLLTLPYDYFLLNDADSFCLSPDIPDYLYSDEAKGVLWSNEVPEMRPHASPYPKMALQPPYFMHRSVIERLLSVADKPQVKAHPITPYIDWYMLALAEESGTPHRSFPDGVSFPAWSYDYIAETQKLGHEPQHTHVPGGRVPGDKIVLTRVKGGAVFVHSVKHKEVMDKLVAAHEQVRRTRNPMSKVAVLVPFRAESNNDTRTRVWDWVRARWEAMVPDADIVVGTDDGQPFSKTVAVNDAYEKSDADVFIICDADAWMEPDAVRRAVAAARQTGRLVVPWKKVVRLSEADTEPILASAPTSEVIITNEMRARAFESPEPMTAGTLFVIRRDSFERVQGMDPRFRGWGCEDISFSRACETLLGPNIYASETVVSLYHARPTIEGRGRVWEGETRAWDNPRLGQAYINAYKQPAYMQALCNQHPLRGATIIQGSRAFALLDPDTVRVEL